MLSNSTCASFKKMLINWNRSSNSYFFYLLCVLFFFNLITCRFLSWLFFNNRLRFSYFFINRLCFNYFFINRLRFSYFLINGLCFFNFFCRYSIIFIGVINVFFILHWFSYSFRSYNLSWLLTFFARTSCWPSHFI